MNDSELKKLLEPAPSPERPVEYWDDFPRRVTAKLYWEKETHGEGERQPQRHGIFSSWGWGLATVCVLAAFAVGFWRGHQSGLTETQAAEARKYYEEARKLFPNQIRAIVFEREGPRLILAENANVPDSPALFVRVCAPDGCRSFVTFSGQKIQVNGETCEVLADANERVMLVGRNRAWANDLPGGRVRVRGGALDTAM